MLVWCAGRSAAGFQVSSPGQERHIIPRGGQIAAQYAAGPPTPNTAIFIGIKSSCIFLCPSLKGKGDQNFTLRYFRSQFQ